MKSVMKKGLVALLAGLFVTGVVAATTTPAIAEAPMAAKHVVKCQKCHTDEHGMEHCTKVSYKKHCKNHCKKITKKAGATKATKEEASTTGQETTAKAATTNNAAHA